ncbi:unnamed protein product, partial [Adineta steineri]
DANQAFEQYREMYFEGGVSSVYFWDLENGFAGVILIKKVGIKSVLWEIIRLNVILYFLNLRKN